MIIHNNKDYTFRKVVNKNITIIHNYRGIEYTIYKKKNKALNHTYYGAIITFNGLEYTTETLSNEEFLADVLVKQQIDNYLDSFK